MLALHTLRTRVQVFVEAALGVRIYRQLPRGMDLFADVERYLPRLRIRHIVDVGAHVGAVAMALRNRFPEAEIHSFEPTPETFQTLIANVAGHDIRTYSIALSNESGTATMRHGVTSDLNQLTMGADARVDGGASISVQTLDDVFGHDAHINYLKIDTEGHDMRVLHGAHALLTAGHIDLVEVEAGMGLHGTSRHVPFSHFHTHLGELGYDLFGVYEQVGDWVAGVERLRRANVVFASNSVLEANAFKSAYVNGVDADPVQG